MKYEDPTFSVSVGSGLYSDNYEQTFGRRVRCAICSTKFNTKSDVPVCGECLNSQTDDRCAQSNAKR